MKPALRLSVILLLSCFSFSPVMMAQTISIKKLSASSLPKPVKIRGTIKDALQWNDKLGDNILVLSVLGPVPAKIADTDEEGNTIELFATHYVKQDSTYKVLWRLNDLVKECTLDYTAEFIKAATTVTDLDKDGIAETTVQYKLACHGDVSPSNMKLIMHEDSTKYALRGVMWMRAAFPDSKFAVSEKNVNLEAVLKAQKVKLEEDYMLPYGRYESEKDFAKAPPAFLTYARRQWLKFVIEKMQE